MSLWAMVALTRQGVFLVLTPDPLPYVIPSYSPQSTEQRRFLVKWWKRAETFVLGLCAKVRPTVPVSSGRALSPVLPFPATLRPFDPTSASLYPPGLTTASPGPCPQTVLGAELPTARRRRPSHRRSCRPFSFPYYAILSLWGAIDVAKSANGMYTMF